MAGYPHFFKDLRLSNKGEVEGINNGLKIMGKGTFKFKIEDDNGRTHKIKIPNSLYLPGLKRCLLLPQHWAQEAGEEHPLPDGTWCKNTANQYQFVLGPEAFPEVSPALFIDEHTSLLHGPFVASLSSLCLDV
jgi:hypothetical protein